jgi:hypothetical protein
MPAALPIVPNKAVHVASKPGNVFLKIHAVIYNIAANP